jgi:hypothetical protein
MLFRSESGSKSTKTSNTPSFWNALNFRSWKILFHNRHLDKKSESALLSLYHIIYQLHPFSKKTTCRGWTKYSDGNIRNYSLICSKRHRQIPTLKNSNWMLYDSLPLGIRHWHYWFTNDDEQWPYSGYLFLFEKRCSSFLAF